MGFLSLLEEEQPENVLFSDCGKCSLYKKCNSPKMEPTGKGKLGVLVVAQSPGKEEDKRGIQLIGPAGQRLRDSLSKIGIDLDRDCWKTNAVVCFKGTTPTDQEVEWCRPNLLKVIGRLKPRLIILLGAEATRSLISKLWKSDVGPIGRWVGWRIPSQRLNAWVCPNWHPSYLLRTHGDPALPLWFDKYLERAFELEGRPWEHNGVDFSKQVKVLPPAAAEQQLREWALCKDAIAFDFETNMLKPDGPRAAIVSCAVCWKGERTMAFRWTPATREVMGYLLASECPKIAANLKFEDRWVRREFGHGVRNWHWDTMQAAHVLDNRPGITSLKFQAFVHFGQPVYDDKIAPYLRADGSRVSNAIYRVNTDDLLLYNGMDALLTWKLYEVQRKLIYGGR